MRISDWSSDVCSSDLKPPPAMTCAPSATVSMPLPVVVPTDSSPVVEKLEPVPDTRAVAPCAIEPMVAELKLATPPSSTENWPLRWSSTPPGLVQFDPAPVIVTVEVDQTEIGRAHV